MEASPLSRLPLELRNRIYEFAVAQERNVTVLVKTGRPRTSSGVDLRFLYTCRQLHEEAALVFYHTNAFTIITKYLESEGDPSKAEAQRPFNGIRTWLDMIGPRNSRQLSRVCIDLGWYGVEGRHSRITDFMDIAALELGQLNLPARAVVLRAAYFIVVFSPIGHTMRYIDIPLADRDMAAQMLETTTIVAKKGLPPYTTNRDEVHHTMDLFRFGILSIVQNKDGNKDAK